jgi:hypothetical protein
MLRISRIESQGNGLAIFFGHLSSSPLNNLTDYVQAFEQLGLQVRVISNSFKSLIFSFW